MVYNRKFISQEAVKQGFTASKWIKSVEPVIGGKGGGKAECAQASGNNYTKLKEASDIALQFAQR